MDPYKPKDGEKAIFYFLYDAVYITDPEAAKLLATARTPLEIIEERYKYNGLETVIVRVFCYWSDAENAYETEFSAIMTKQEISASGHSPFSEYSVDEILQNPEDDSDEDDEDGDTGEDYITLYMLYPIGYTNDDKEKIQPLSRHSSMKDLVKECQEQNHPKGTPIVMREIYTERFAGEITSDILYIIDYWDPEETPKTL